MGGLSQILHISMRSCADFENENLLDLHSKVIANMPLIPPPPRVKHNYPSEPSPRKKVFGSALQL